MVMSMVAHASPKWIHTGTSALVLAPETFANL